MTRLPYLLLLAGSGGFFAIVFAIVEEAMAGQILVVFLVGPAIEEVLKPSGVYWLMSNRPGLLSSRFEVALLAAMSGAIFGVIENLIYLHIYIPDHDPGLAIYRHTVCTLLHTGTSAILGWGIGGQLETLKKAADLPEVERTVFFELEPALPWVATAIGVHAAYNTTVFFLETAGVRLY